MIDYERHILALNDVELEKLVRCWADCQKEKYVSSKRYAGAGDLGRDVVGFFTTQKHEGAWDNYQCKQYGKPLPTDRGIVELGKIIYYSYKGNFILPNNYYFVAPKNVNRNLQGLFDNPTRLENYLIENWDKYCKCGITDTEEIELTPKLIEYIKRFDFTSISVIDIDEMVIDDKFKNILAERFGGDYSAAPDGVVPDEIQLKESIYIGELLRAYSDYDGTNYIGIDEIIGHEEFGFDLEIQRERYYSADAFKCYYRDSTLDKVVNGFEKEIFKGIYDVSRKRYDTGYDKMCGVMSQAASISVSGKLGIHAKVDVKQGCCHHFVNDKKLKWVK